MSGVRPKFTARDTASVGPVYHMWEHCEMIARRQLFCFVVVVVHQ